ncbi:MAG: malto-oligosyltrehalose trehalohydrolase [Vampirovibrionales bacterium]|nr:malto-oligosyltrehalose trehalohydrolase [Vampirovibrionales bacterium]
MNNSGHYPQDSDGGQANSTTAIMSAPLKRRPPMTSFGAYLTLDPDTGDKPATVFQLWAPGVSSSDGSGVQLLLPRLGQKHAMKKEENGFFRLKLNNIPAGTLYHYEIISSGNVLPVPDPASRYQPEDVHGPSCVIDPNAFDWASTENDWKGRPLAETIIYELHVGTYTPEGTFKALETKLDYLCQLGVTAIELMPISEFPGGRNWGYDGVLPFAPESRYGHPDDLKRLIQSAHQKGLMVFLDVVYNHFGPDGNYLHAYAQSFFTRKHQTPWGDAINFDDSGSEVVRKFFVENALYWLNEYHFDGLRLDAVHAIKDNSSPDILEEIAAAVHTAENAPGRSRHIHLMLENERNQARYLKPDHYAAQWNDDIHHALHVLISGESSGYYADYAERPIEHLGRCLSEGFAYQGEISHFGNSEPRGEKSDALPSTCFVSFIQNHDQIGNRAFGDRLSHFAHLDKLRVAAEIYLLAPQIPMLFMGEEWAASTPFTFFCDFHPELAQAVTEGRRKEFSRFEEFSDPKNREKIPDPSSLNTYESAILKWEEKDESTHAQWLLLYQKLLSLRQQFIVPFLKNASGKYSSEDGCAEFITSYEALSDEAVHVSWQAKRDGGETLWVYANFSERDVPCQTPNPSRVCEVLYASGDENAKSLLQGKVPPYSVTWFYGC